MLRISLVMSEDTQGAVLAALMDMTLVPSSTKTGSDSSADDDFKPFIILCIIVAAFIVFMVIGFVIRRHTRISSKAKGRGFSQNPAPKKLSKEEKRQIREKEKYDEKIRSAQKPGNTKAQLELGEEAFNDGNTNKAKEWFNRIANDPGSDEGHRAKALLRLMQINAGKNDHIEAGRFAQKLVQKQLISRLEEADHTEAEKTIVKVVKALISDKRSNKNTDPKTAFDIAKAFSETGSEFGRGAYAECLRSERSPHRDIEKSLGIAKELEAGSGHYFKDEKEKREFIDTCENLIAADLESLSGEIPCEELRGRHILLEYSSIEHKRIGAFVNNIQQIVSKFEGTTFQMDNNSFHKLLSIANQQDHKLSKAAKELAHTLNINLKNNKFSILGKGEGSNSVSKYFGEKTVLKPAAAENYAPAVPAAGEETAKQAEVPRPAPDSFRRPDNDIYIPREGDGILYGGSGRKYNLGKMIDGGGEGAVYRISGRTGEVIKIFNEKTFADGTKLAKITAGRFCLGDPEERKKDLIWQNLTPELQDMFSKSFSKSCKKSRNENCSY